VQNSRPVGTRNDQNVNKMAKLIRPAVPPYFVPIPKKVDLYPEEGDPK